jgi:hypothetical protein
MNPKVNTLKYRTRYREQLAAYGSDAIAALTGKIQCDTLKIEQALASATLLDDDTCGSDMLRTLRCAILAAAHQSPICETVARDLIDRVTALLESDEQGEAQMLLVVALTGIQSLLAGDLRGQAQALLEDYHDLAIAKPELFVSLSEQATDLIVELDLGDDHLSSHVLSAVEMSHEFVHNPTPDSVLEEIAQRARANVEAWIARGDQ